VVFNHAGVTLYTDQEEMCHGTIFHGSISLCKILSRSGNGCATRAHKLKNVVEIVVFLQLFWVVFYWA